MKRLRQSQRVLPFIPYVISYACARLVNRTIDDEILENAIDKRPVYAPEHAWAQGATCAGCKAAINASDTWKGTWHDTTQHPENATFTMMATFTGTAVYVYNILANYIPYSSTLTDITFTLDGALVSNFTHAPSNDSGYEYHALVYANRSLENINHTLLMKAAKRSEPVLILFDYLIYTALEDDVLPLPVSSIDSTQVCLFLIILPHLWSRTSVNSHPACQSRPSAGRKLRRHIRHHPPTSRRIRTLPLRAKL